MPAAPRSLSAVEASFSLNRALDVARCATTFGARGRIHVPDLLPARAVERLHAWLAQSAQWSLVLHDGQNVRAEATPEHRRRADEVWEREMAAFA